MQTEKNHIPSSLEGMDQGGIGVQQWLDYLEGGLPDDQRRQMAEAIDRSAFLKEALEGLRPIQDKTDLHAITQQLNLHFQKQLSARKRPRRKQPPMPFFWVTVTLVIVLIIIFLGYYFYTRL